MEKNIVILRIETGNISGVVRYVQMLTEGLLCKDGIKVHIICLDTSLIFPKIEEIDGRVIANIPFPTKSESLKSDFYWLTKYFRVVSELLLPYFKNKNQLIWHVQELLLAKLADVLKFSLGGYIITHLHIIPWKLGIEKNECDFKIIYSQWMNNIFNLISENQLEKIAYSISDKIICVSYSAMKHIAQVYHVNPNKISVIYNGMDNSGISLRSRKEAIPEVLFVGRISREKGVLGLLNALNKVFSRGYSCKLKLIGQCSSYMSAHIHKAYKQLDIEMLGAVSFSELKELYTESTIGIIPSLHEQCSYVAIEMSMFGMPIIVSDVDALSEMFEDEVNALKIPLVFDEDFGLELDEEKLADTIIRLIDDDPLRRKLSVNALRNFQERFTLGKMIENTINVYDQLINQDNA